MVKYVLTGVGGGIGSIAADYAVENQNPEDELVLTSSDVSKLAPHSVKAWKAKGAIVEQANYSDVESLKKVFQGAEAVAFISTWLIGDGRRGQMKNCIQAAKEVGVKRICYTSFVGAGSDKPNEELPFLPQDHQFTEQQIYASGLDYNIQRNYLYQDNTPCLFAQSWHYTEDRWLANSHDVPGAYVAKSDCGRVFGALLLGRQEKNTVVEVTGPEAVTDREMFEWMNGISGYKAEFVDMPDEQLRAYWLERGLPTDVDGDFSQLPMKLCMNDLLCCGKMLADGSMSKVTDTVERLTGRKPLSYKENLLQYVDIFPKNP
ncbi:NmrA-like [Plasmopara halstedii]|uniref:NmrA-like n=1 Tax=Plasmopara halstedii TaxID=4781 RepID=A0A0P1A6L4_PLAHL|nr:NmrA-like [Plasmopara halstedii]CEG36023.1 NmrA-like [Plasmopara halstedii]|eukprot:XP_024572392.1 NmrA-like [Plasmopara halstedii]